MEHLHDISLGKNLEFCIYQDANNYYADLRYANTGEVIQGCIYKKPSQKEIGKFARINLEDPQDYLTDTYDTEQEVIDDAERYYHENFRSDEDYDENFEIKDFEHSVEFWSVNGYEIFAQSRKDVQIDTI